jgi:2-hydroxy-3-oxopropionate reductase
MEKIAFLGTGLMGRPMAENLLKAGYPVAAWNRTRAKAEALAPFGAHISDSAPEAVSDAAIVISMLENGPVVQAVMAEMSDRLSPNAVVIDMSSIPPETARTCASTFADRGIAFLDAPVSGGEVGAKAGTLAIMAGGDRDAFERVKSVFAPMGRATYVGPSGAGQLAKLANQVIVAVTIGAVAEALLLAQAGGADPAAVRSAIMGGFAESRILTLHGERMIERNFVPGGASRNQLKDISTALSAADMAGIALPLTEAVGDLFRALVDNGGAEWDHSALVVELERRNPTARIGTKPDRLP